MPENDPKPASGRPGAPISGHGRRRSAAVAVGLAALLAVGAVPTIAAADTPRPANSQTPLGDWWPWPWPTPTPTSSPSPSPTSTQPSPGNSKLNLTELVQDQDQWCWAATGLSIAQYLGYGKDIDQNTFCLKSRGLAGGQCPNQPAELSVVQNGWQQLGLRAGTEADGSISYSTVQNEIKGNRPIETGVYWTAGGGHARIIYGYDAGNGTIFFSDPWPSNERYQEMSYDSYVSNSQFRWGGTVYQVGM